MIQVRGFNGKLNKDDNPYRSPKNDHVDALNITRDAEGEGQDAVVSNVVGNQEAYSQQITCEVIAEAEFWGDVTYQLFFTGIVLTGSKITVTAVDDNTYETIILGEAISAISLDSVVSSLYQSISQTSLNYYVTDLVQFGSNLIQFKIPFWYSISNVEVSTGAPQSYGIQKTIGNYADRVRNRHYYFVWSSFGYHQINYYDANNGRIVNIIEDKTRTGGVSILNFDPSFRINHIDIIYRDGDGDLLFWTDGLNPPSKINVEKAVSFEYQTIQRSFIDVAKEPPSMPPQCVYEDDPSVKSNNLNNKQFKFKYRFVYDDLEKSVTSAHSEVPIPKNYTDQANLTDPTKNADIFILVQTGAANVTKIEILAAESLGNVYSDFFLITVLDKAELGLLNNDTAFFRFYNDQAYIPISIEESIQPFDLVPQKAYTQSLPNGSVLNYGAITEGYNLVTGNMTISNSTTQNPSVVRPTSLVYTNIVYHPTLGKSLELIVAGAPNNGEDFGIGIYDSEGVSFGIVVNYFVPSTGVVSQQTLLTGLNAALVANGLVLNIINGRFYYTGAPLDALDYTVNFFIPNFDAAIKSKNSVFAYDWSSKYNYGVVYFDEKGRTNGVVSPLSATFGTSAYYETPSTDPNPYSPYIPSQDVSIFNRPPIWASYYHVVRTNNLTKANFLYWVSERTFKDQFQNEAGYQYAYISISTLLEYIQDNPEFKNLGYEFAPGDRIRFVKLYNYNTQATNQIYNVNSKDFEILDSITKPKINGQEYDGQFIKITLPPTSSSFDFGGDAYANYLIELYTPTKSFGTNNTLYYEFGQRYGIGNPHTGNAFHRGMNANQSANLVNPATFTFIKGDSYFRYRLFPRGGSMRWLMNIGGGIHVNGTRGGNLISDTSNNTASYTPVAAPTSWWYGNPAGNPTKLVNIVNQNRKYSWKIKGTVTLSSDTYQSNSYVEFYSSNPTAGTFQVVTVQVGPLQPNVLVTVPYERDLETKIGDDYVACVVKGAGGNGNIFDFWFAINNWEITITENNSIYQGIVDPNFSDTIESSPSPNGRAWIYDPNATQEFNPTLIRFSGEYQLGTTINNTNRFYDKNFDAYDRSKGAIKKMFIEGRNLYCFQEFDVGVVTIFTQIVRDTAGNPLSAETDRLLNKIVYPYQGGYGIGNVPESFAYGKGAKYFVDNNKGVVCRLAADGITPISVVYKMNAFFVNKLKAYKDTLNPDLPLTGLPTIYGAYDAYTNKYIIALSLVQNPYYNQDPITISYSESLGDTKGFESFLSYHPENMGAINNLFITFLDGKLWTHNSNTYCNFYGNQYNSHIDVVFNDNPLDRKTYQAINETSNSIWHCPLITSQALTGNAIQESSISAPRFSLLEGQYSAAVLRDANSPGGLINGQTLHGNYLIVRFQKDNPTAFYFLNTVSLKYVNSQLNVR